MSQDGQRQKWWERRVYPSFGSRWDFDVRWIQSSLIQDAFGGQDTVRLKHSRGNLAQKPEEFVKNCEETLSLKLIQISPYTKEGSGLYVLASETAMLSADLHGKGEWADINLVTNDEALFKRGLELLAKQVLPDDPETGPVYTLAKTTDGYQIIRIGAAGIPLERENYTPKVIEDYDHIVTDLKTCSPCGRLIVLSGEPGTGKTYLVRSLLREVSNATFILIPPHLVRSLGDPEILPSLTSAKQEMEGPVVLLAEDADMCLVPRQGDNMSTISSVLNLGDGILGSLLDIRIIATTNAAKINMDKASLREGRLCREVEVGPIGVEQATQILQRLVPEAKGLTFNTKSSAMGFKAGSDNSQVATLAQVYARARAEGWKPPAPKSKEDQINEYLYKNGPKPVLARKALPGRYARGRWFMCRAYR